MQGRSREYPCRVCNRVTRQELSVQVSTNKYKHVGWHCQNCRRWQLSDDGRSLWLSHKDIGIDVDTLPIASVSDPHPCCVTDCRDTGTELHHFAPRAIYGDDCDKHPTAYYCRKHHREWHERVTPQLCRGAAKPPAEDNELDLCCYRRVKEIGFWPDECSSEDYHQCACGRSLLGRVSSG